MNIMGLVRPPLAIWSWNIYRIVSSFQPAIDLHISDRGGGRPPELIDILFDIHRTMQALDQARVRVASILNLPDPQPLPPPHFFHDFFDPMELSRIRRKNRTSLDDAVLRCLLS